MGDKEATGAEVREDMKKMAVPSIFRKEKKKRQVSRWQSADYVKIENQLFARAA